MVVSTCTGYDANLQYLKGEKPIRTTLKPVSVINLVACPYLEYINMFFAGCLEQCHILLHSNLQLNKRIYLPAYANVN